MTPKRVMYGWLRDWLFLSPAAVWIATFLTIVSTKNLLYHEVVSGSLFTYAIALSFSHRDSSVIIAWRESHKRHRELISDCSELLHWVVVGASLILLILTMLEPYFTKPIVADRIIAFWSMGCATSAFAGSAVSLLMRHASEPVMP